MSDMPSDEDLPVEDSKFRRSKWLSRGWTLQELVAPQYLTFFGSAWKENGTKYRFQAFLCIGNPNTASPIPSKNMNTPSRR
ncbi:hypothetical protein PV04_00578 [Phialophora macrospora]|uniref:Uncharacterized protein n=1 Tax=Phialophora macrospora TaxID=1851006 RepID=A0A0D2G0X2_9EURO|nr:hypothetical protein PV04_00578 [Phialophora macrospora]